MVLDHSTLGQENKSGRMFCVRQVYFTESCQQVWGRVDQPFILFIHHIWGEIVPWGAVFITQSSDRMQYFAIQFALIQYWQATYFSTKNPINKVAMNNRRLFVAAEFHLVHSVEKDREKHHKLTQKLCQLQLSK